MSILSDHQDAAIRKNRKHDHRSRMRDNFASNLDPNSGFEYGLAPNAENASLEHNFAAHNLSQRFFLAHAISCHSNMAALFYRAIAPCAIIAARLNARHYFAYSRFLLQLLRLHILTSESMPINTVIVDDERPARDELAYLLKAFPELEVIAQGKNGLEAVALIKEHDPDLVFLDVQMPGLDGFGVIKKLVERKLRMPQIVFATAFDNHAVHAFEVNAVDYVLKPFDKGRIAKAVQRVKKMVEANTSPVERLETLGGRGGMGLGAALPKPRQTQPVKLLVRSQARMILVDAEDMIYASIEDGTITIFAADVEGASSFRTIEELAEALDEDVFWRAHRSYLVNINHIKEVVPWFKSSYMLKMNDKRQSE